MPPRVGVKRKAEESEGGGVRKQTPVERHDSAFIDPMRIFASNPQNTTFIECRHQSLRAIPEDFDAESVTFMYRGTPYGLIKSSEATLGCDMSIRTIANQAVGRPAQPDWLNAGGGANPDGRQVVSVVTLLLRTMFKSKDIYINDDIINNTNADEYISWVRHLSTQVKSDYLDSDEINLAIHDNQGTLIVLPMYTIGMQMMPILTTVHLIQIIV